MKPHFGMKDVTTATGCAIFLDKIRSFFLLGIRHRIVQWILDALGAYNDSDCVVRVFS